MTEREGECEAGRERQGERGREIDRMKKNYLHNR